jgi:hypothetical protein
MSLLRIPRAGQQESCPRMGAAPYAGGRTLAVGFSLPVHMLPLVEAIRLSLVPSVLRRAVLLGDRIFSGGEKITVNGYV